MSSIAQKAAEFAALHTAGTFLIPNAWDPGSARVMASLDAKAIATTSAGFAFSRAVPDMVPSRAEVIGNATAIAASVDVPVSADLVDFFADTPEGIAETVRMAADAGLVGATLEDAIPTSSGEPIRLLDDAVARVRAAVAAVSALPHRFILTARAENYIHGRNDLVDTIERLRAFATAGADVVYAPGVVDPDEIRQLVRAVPAAVNVLAGIGGNSLTVADYQTMGVRRISFGGTLWGIAHGAVRDAMRTLTTAGSFAGFSNQLSFPEASALFANRKT